MLEGLNDKLVKNYIALVFVTSLFFTFTNLVYFSTTFFLLVPIVILLFPFLLFRTIHKSIFYLLLFLLYSLISLLLYNPSSLMEFDFYRRDGNMYITLMPLVLLSFFTVKVKLVDILKFFLIFVTIIELLGVVIFGKVLESYRLWFVAHNAAGGYIGVILMMTLGLYWAERKKWVIGLILVQLLLLYLTGSRGSIVGVVLAVGAFIFNRKFEMIILIGSLTSLIVLLCFTYPIWDKNYRNSYNSFSVDEMELSLNRGGTFIIRGFYLWPRAVDNFFESPLTGLGMGSYNDRNYAYKRIVPLVSTKQNTLIENSSAHAHNTFLNILAELGIFGMLLFCLFLFYLRRFIVQIPDSFLSTGLFLTFWMIFYSSFTEHRFVTPSQSLPFMIIVGLALSLYSNEEVSSKA